MEKVNNQLFEENKKIKDEIHEIKIKIKTTEFNNEELKAEIIKLHYEIEDKEKKSGYIAYKQIQS